MLIPKIKHVLKVIFVFVVIAGLVLSYLFTGAPRQTSAPAPEETSNFDFSGPTNAPSVTDPLTAPAVGGPTTPPPSGQ